MRKVFNIPSGVSFVDVLARGLLARYGGERESLAAATVLLPTRRAIRSLGEALLRASDGQALLLPNLRAIGDVDEEELSFSAGSGADQLALPPAIEALRRRLLLAQLIRGARRETTPAQAADLALDLSAFLDLLQTEGVTLGELSNVVRAEFAAHWQVTLDFLNLLDRPWRDLLAAEGVMEPAERRSALIAELARRWQAEPPEAPVIAAGSTGTVPATRRLLAVIAELPRGAVVLPGLDLNLSEEDFQSAAEAHPQFSLKQTLAALEVTRDEVGAWVKPSHGASGGQRAKLMSEVLRPTETTEAWRDIGALDDAATAGLRRIDCPGPREEAGVIALAMREVLETPEASAALVTPDRNLALRVAAELQRWGIAVDDSAGVPLPSTRSGTFLRLVLAAVAERAAPHALLALLKHPLSAAGMAPAALRALARELEIRFLRGPRGEPGFTPLRDLVSADSKAPAPLRALIEDLAERAAPLQRWLVAGEAKIEDLLEAQVALSEWLATDDSAVTRLWQGEDGEEAARFIAELHQAADGLRALAGRDYPAYFATLMAERHVRPVYGRHPRLHIWGPLEARLQQADRLILGGLNEGTWPALGDAGPWLNRPMRVELQLPSPERRIGLASHDFQQAAAAADVILTRAAKVDGAPTVPSRWLLRLDQVLAAAGRDIHWAEGAKWRDWERQLQAPEQISPRPAPAPRPPVAARPRELSVTQIETWIKDPYALYARHILGLRPLEEIDADPGVAERGTIIHKALERFAARYPNELPADALARLIEMGRDDFAEFWRRPAVRAFWWPRFKRISAWFIAKERELRPTRRAAGLEVAGRIAITTGRGTFTVKAVADRIDRAGDGSLAIIDYKTGAIPQKRDLLDGTAPQLPLEAAIAAQGGFDEIAAAQITELAFWRLSGARKAGDIVVYDIDIDALKDQALAGLERLVAAFDDVRSPYRARPRPEVALRYNDYEHLARILEWSAGGPGDGL